MKLKYEDFYFFGDSQDNLVWVCYRSRPGAILLNYQTGYWERWDRFHSTGAAFKSLKRKVIPNPRAVWRAEGMINIILKIPLDTYHGNLGICFVKEGMQTDITGYAHTAIYFDDYQNFNNKKGEE